MISISPGFTYDGSVAALLGGIGIGLTAVFRTASLGELLPSSTFHIVGTPAMMAASFATAKWLDTTSFFELSPSGIETNALLRQVAAGALVGCGASLGSGCTSGNGIQGLAALSTASLAFVAIFMIVGAVTVKTLATAEYTASDSKAWTNHDPLLSLRLFGIVFLLACLQFVAGRHKRRRVAAAFGGAAFSISLVLSSMPKASRVVGFLDILNARNGWDPTLIFVMGGGLLVTIPSYAIFGLAAKESSIGNWATRPVTGSLILGATLFGAGWGLCGVCPGPGIVNVGAAMAINSPSVEGTLASGGAWTISMFLAKSFTDNSIVSSSTTISKSTALRSRIRVASDKEN